MDQTPHLSTQEKLGREAGLGQSTVGRIRRGEVDPTVDTLDALAKAFRVPVSTFFQAEAPEAPTPVCDDSGDVRVRLAFPFSTMSPMQLAVADRLSQLVGTKGLSDAECLALLNTWAQRDST
jgi:transcriptional regulator with XRE-family HTH domain